MSAEQAYLFRHALLRDAAYALQLPRERAALHALALRIIESTAAEGELDLLAAELATHAHYAQQGDDPALRAMELAYVWRAAEFASRQYDAQAGIRWLDQAAGLDPDPARRAEAMHRAANALLTTGRAEEGVPRIQQALALMRDARHTKMKGALLVTLAGIHQMRGRLPESEAMLNEALPLSRACGDRETEGRAVANLAAIMRATGRSDEAYAMHQLALEIHRAAGNRHGEAVALGNIAVHHFDRGRNDQALEYFRQSLALNREIGRRRSEGVSQGMMAWMLACLGRFAEAEENYFAALAIDREVSNRAYEAWHTCELALVTLYLGRPQEAREMWLKGREQMLAWGDGPDLGKAQAQMRRACIDAGVAQFDET